MFDFITICRALSDENRVRILMALRGRRLCVCQITAFLDLAPSTTSKHLSILKQARLIESHKDGRWVYYRLADSAYTSPLVREALRWMQEGIRRAPLVLQDETHIVSILADINTCGLTSEEREQLHSLELHQQDLAAADETLDLQTKE